MQRASSSERPVVQPYDPAWRSRAEAAMSAVAGAAGPLALRLEHIGSTAVPGMSSKDVIDVQLSVGSLDEALGTLPEPLAGIGFQRKPFDFDHVPAGRDDDPGLWSKGFFARRDHPDGDVNLHVRRVGSPGERFALLFRDWFRAHPEAIPAYAEFKRRLAADVDGRTPYSDMKDPVVDLVIVVAEAWAANTDWRP